MMIMCQVQSAVRGVEGCVDVEKSVCKQPISHMRSDGNDRGLYRAPLERFVQMHEESVDLAWKILEGVDLLDAKICDTPLSCHTFREWEIKLKIALKPYLVYLKAMDLSKEKVTQVLCLQKLWTVDPRKSDNLESNRFDNSMRSTEPSEDSGAFSDSLEDYFEKVQQLCSCHMYLEENMKKHICEFKSLMADEGDAFFHQVKKNLHEYSLLTDYRVAPIKDLLAALGRLRERYGAFDAKGRYRRYAAH